MQLLNRGTEARQAISDTTETACHAADDAIENVRVSSGRLMSSNTQSTSQQSIVLFSKALPRQPEEKLSTPQPMLSCEATDCVSDLLWAKCVVAVSSNTAILSHQGVGTITCQVRRPTCLFTPSGWQRTVISSNVLPASIKARSARLKHYPCLSLDPICNILCLTGGSHPSCFS